jgi:glycosyltransferase involved in cell wall biosynthesis
LFDAGYYLETYPDVALENVNPLRHYVEFGSKEGRSPHYLFDPAFVLRNCPGVSPHGRTVLEQFLESHSGRGASPHWMFDSSFYLARNPDIAATGRGPWRHFLESGASDQRDPHPLFDCSFYLSTQPDVRRSGLNPLEHFIRYGAREGRSPHFLFDFTAYLSARPELGTFQNVAQHAGEAAQARLARNRERRIQRMSRFIHDQSRARRAALKPRLSVVIPTYNRAEILEGTLQRCLQLSQHLPVEFLVVSDGSTDNTLDCLNWYSRQFPSLHFAAIEKSGPGAARNVGAAQAKGELIMFMGDDIRPADSEFFAAHLRAHEKFSDAGAIVEGHIKWPNQSGFAINAVMRLIQGSGAQQFAYHYMQPFAFFDWRYFWTANTSIKRTLVKDWSKDGFNPVFNKAACEDTEFAYRQAKVWANLRIYYAADSVGEHFHPYRVGTFVDRQRNVGEMTRALLDLHPELASHMSVEELDTALRSGRPDPKDVRLLPEFEGVVRGLQSWGAIMEAHEDLGSQEWHDTYLNALFQLSHGEGYLNTFRGKGGNLAEGYRVLLRRFHQRLSGSRAAAPLMHTIAIS